MKEIKETFLRKYGIWEYILLVLGVFIEVKLAIDFWNDDFGYSFNEIGASVFGILLIAFPLTLLDIIRKKTGLQTREEKYNSVKNENNNE